jgi:hypothetical protein
MEQDVKSAARKLIVELSRIAQQEDHAQSAGPAHYQSMLAQLALAQLALTYPQATLGTCMTDGTPLHFTAKEDGLYICCEAEEQHGWKVSAG